MKRIYAFALVALLLVTGCSNSLAAQLVQYQKDVQLPLRSFAGHEDIVRSTAKIALSPIIAMLQDDQQAFYEISVPEPMKIYREDLYQAMGIMIRGYLQFEADEPWESTYKCWALCFRYRLLADTQLSSVKT